LYQQYYEEEALLSLVSSSPSPIADAINDEADGSGIQKG